MTKKKAKTKKRASPKQLAQRKKFKKATETCKKENGDYRGCMKTQLNKK